MFETIVSEVANFFRSAVRAVASAIQRAPWVAVLAAVALLAVLW